MIFVLLGLALASMLVIGKHLNAEVRKQKMSLQATYFHCDLGDKIWEMLEDPLTSESDWIDILPICRYADEWFAKTHPYIREFSRKEDIVINLMA